MELTELQKHDESKVTVFIFHSLAFLKFVWCNLNNKIFLKCFSFTAANFLSHSLYVFVNWSSILTFQYCLFDQLSDEAGEERSADNIILITVSATQTGGVSLHQVVLLQIELQYCVLYGRKHKPDVLGVWNSHEKLFKGKTQTK